MPLKFIAQKDGSLDIEIYDVIGLWGLTVADLAAKLKAVKGKDVNLRINSPGGSITEGLAIYNVLQRHDGMVTAHIDGVAASMAGIVAMAAKKIVMPENSFIMIHNPSVDMNGSSDELRQAAGIMDKMASMIITALTRGGKVGRKVVEAMMTGESSAQEHWLTAAECLELGLCDEVTSDVAAAALLTHSAYYSYHKFAAMTAEPLPSDTTSGGSAKQPISNMKAIITALGLLATATEAEVASEATNVKNRVATLEREAKDKDTSHADALTKAKNAALQQATDAEKIRKAALATFAAKYNKDGDLNTVLVTALSGDTTPDQFKDIVLEVVNVRPTKGAVKPDGGKGGETTEVTDIASFKVAYAACKNEVETRALVRKHRAFARQASLGRE